MARKNTKGEAVPATNQFTLEGKTYKVVHGIIAHTETGQVKLTAADICVQEEVQKMLVAGGSSAIQEVTE